MSHEISSKYLQQSKINKNSKFHDFSSWVPPTDTIQPVNSVTDDLTKKLSG